MIESLHRDVFKGGTPALCQETLKTLQAQHLSNLHDRQVPGWPSELEDTKGLESVHSSHVEGCILAFCSDRAWRQLHNLVGVIFVEILVVESHSGEDLSRTHRVADQSNLLLSGCKDIAQGSLDISRAHLLPGKVPELFRVRRILVIF